MTEPISLEGRFAKKCRRTGHHLWSIPTGDYSKNTPADVRVCRRPTCEAVKQWTAFHQDREESAYLHRVRGGWGEPKSYAEVNA